MKITTKTGDDGKTGLFGGRRVSKASPWMGALGDLDELTSMLGWCKCVQGSETRVFLERVQDDIYRVMSFVGFEGRWPSGARPLNDEDVESLEKMTEKFEAEVGEFKKFIRPGSSEKAARLHVTRAVSRRAERSVVGVLAERENESEEEAKVVLRYINRLSDLLFMMAFLAEKEIITEG